MINSHAQSIKKVQTLQIQKKTLATLVNKLEERNANKPKAMEKLCSRQDQISSEMTGIDYITSSQMTPCKEGGLVMGSGSYGACQRLSMWKNLKVCVKKVHGKINAKEVKHEAAMLKKLQQSLYVPVLLGINIIQQPFYIVTSFHSATPESSLTLHSALMKCTSIKKEKWMSIFHKCALGLKSLHDLGVIHNDLHQKNILLDRLNGHTHPVIIDFGKACKVGNGRCRKVGDVVMYSELHPWVAPETVRGEDSESEQSDVYSFGYIINKFNRVAKVDTIGTLALHCQSQKCYRPSMGQVIESLKEFCRNDKT
ncbi:serine/threonine/tyrosine-protein kinase HT1 [Nematostella vectensis]|uniref:serine/threonine/tyrosine-protein kinase HT1 n=1 Tax=Nematostella vectensis TaxID=45351 RepID=UPI002077194B|nr:serine/threonine/tyrosine-protein kinase HT1 [Nematostella vectensis]